MVHVESIHNVMIQIALHQSLVDTLIKTNPAIDNNNNHDTNDDNDDDATGLSFISQDSLNGLFVACSIYQRIYFYRMIEHIQYRSRSCKAHG